MFGLVQKFWQIPDSKGAYSRISEVGAERDNPTRSPGMGENMALILVAVLET